jgi:FAD/FMN-containing dehydrogenase
MTNTLILECDGRGLCTFTATDENTERLSNRLVKRKPSTDPHDFKKGATRLMDAVGDLAGPDLDMVVFMAIRQIAKAAMVNEFPEKILVNLMRGDDGKFRGFEISDFAEAYPAYGLTLEYAGRKLISFLATPENIKGLMDEVTEAHPQLSDFLRAATRLMDDPDNPAKADCGLLIAMALNEIGGADASDETIADVLKAKNVNVRLVRHDDAGVFHFHFYNENGDDHDDEGQTLH